jgi:exosortase/archaeosortase family protein
MVTGKDILHKLAPYKDILIFVVALMVSNYFWKFTVQGEENGLAVTWFGLDITAPFAWMSEVITNAVYWMVSLFRDSIYQTDAITLRFTSGTTTRIVWACTPIKQSFIWLCILLATPGDWKSKIWFIPFGWICIFIINILRIFAITMLIEHHPEWFDLLHTYIFKYLFYGLMFLLWVWYVEKIRKPVSSSDKD